MNCRPEAGILWKQDFDIRYFLRIKFIKYMGGPDYGIQIREAVKPGNAAGSLFLWSLTAFCRFFSGSLSAAFLYFLEESENIVGAFKLRGDR